MQLALWLPGTKGKAIERSSHLTPPVYYNDRDYGKREGQRRAFRLRAELRMQAVTVSF